MTVLSVIVRCCSGNTDPRGFGHTGFLVDNLQAACDYLDQNGVRFQVTPRL